MILAVEVPSEVLALMATIFVFVLTLGAGLMSWVMLQAVRLGQIVSRLEARLEAQDHAIAGHDRAIEALELRELQRGMAA